MISSATVCNPGRLRAVAGFPLILAVVLFFEVSPAPAQVDQFIPSLDREIDRLIVGFRPDQYVESRSLGSVDRQWREIGFIPFVCDWGETVYPNSVPAPERRGGEIRTFASLGETVPVAFGIRTLDSPVTGLRIIPGGLVNEDTAGFIPPDSIRTAVVEYGRIRWGEGSSARRWRWHPVRIWPLGKYPGSRFCATREDGTLEVGAAVAQVFWLEISVSLDAAAGRYSGDMLVETARGACRIPLFLTVLPVRLEKGELPPCGVFIPGPQDSFACRDLAGHGVNSTARWFDPGQLSPVSSAGQPSFDFRLEDLFMKRLAGHGISGPQILYAATPESSLFESSLAHSADSLSRQPADLTYAQAAQVILEHSRKNGWPRQVWGVLDRLRPGSVDLELFVSRAAALRKVMDGRINIVSPLVTGREPKLAARIEPYVSVWLIGEDVKPDERMRRSAVWGYVALTQRDAGTTARARLGFAPWFRELDGVLVWAYNWPGGGHPWNDFDSERMDWMLSYRYLDDSYVPTPAWEGIREGIQDRRWLITLEKSIGSLPYNYPPAERARGFLAGLKSGPPFDSLAAQAVPLPENAPQSTDRSLPGRIRQAIAGHLVELARPGQVPADSR